MGVPAQLRAAEVLGRDLAQERARVWAWEGQVAAAFSCAMVAVAPPVSFALGALGLHGGNAIWG